MLARKKQIKIAAFTIAAIVVASVALGAIGFGRAPSSTQGGQQPPLGHSSDTASAVQNNISNYVRYPALKLNPTASAFAAMRAQSSSLLSSQQCLVTGYGTSHTAIYSTILNQNGAALHITSVTFFSNPEGIFALVVVNTAQLSTQKETSPCDLKVSSNTILWDVVNAQTANQSFGIGSIDPTVGASFKPGTSGAFYLEQPLGATGQQGITTEIVDQDGKGLQIVQLNFWKHYDTSASKYHLWADIVVDTSQTYVPVLGSGQTTNFGSGMQTLRWQPTVSGKVADTQTTFYGGLSADGIPIVCQGVA